MSRKSSSSNSGGWTVVRRDDAEAIEGSSDGSIDFVKLENPDSVSYHQHASDEANRSGSIESEQKQYLQVLTNEAPSELTLNLTVEDIGADAEIVSDQTEVDMSEPKNHRDLNKPMILGFVEEIGPNTTASFEVFSQVSVQTENNKAHLHTPGDEHVGSSGQSNCLAEGFAEDKKEDKVNSDSDSDHSDFVRLDPYLAEAEESMGTALGNTTAGSQDDVMRLSDISTTSSSLSSSFRFIHRSGMVLGAEQYMKRRMYRDNDTDSVQSDVDDRCESDISGVADDDLSSYSLGEVPISAGNVVRSYTHRPNNNLNRTLTTLALVVLFAAMGIGIGHYMGTRSGSRLRKQQVEKIQNLSDDYLICLQHQEELEDAMLKQTAKQNLAAALENDAEQLHSQCQNNQQHEQAVDSQLLEGQLIDLAEENSALKKRVGALLYSQAANENTETKDVQVSEEKGLILEHEPGENLDATLRTDLSEKEEAIQFLSIELAETNAKLDETTKSLADTNDKLFRANQELALASVKFEEVNDEVVKITEALKETNEELFQSKDKLLSAENIALLWHSLFQLESDRKSEKDEDSQNVISYLGAVLDDAVVTFKSGLQNLTQASKSQLEMFRNLTQDQTLSDALKMKWNQLKSVIDGPAVQGAAEKAKQLYDDIHIAIKEKIVQSQATSYSDMESVERSNIKEETASDKTPSSQKQQRKDPFEKTEEKNEGHFEKVMNKTKESVQILSDKINKTWHQVKDISSSVISTVAPIVVKKSEAVASKLDSGWQRIKHKVQEGWFHHKYDSKRNPGNSFEENKKQNRKHKVDIDERKQYHGDPYWNSPVLDDDDGDWEFHFPQPHPKSNEFENKPDHKQRQSTTHHDAQKSNKKYEEFWGAVGFDPDDVFHDDFFQGNDRKWRKHERKLRKLHGRIRKLNEDVLFEMDDDEIEDLYEDLDDFEDDLDDEVQPASLKMWLSCQIRWWKSRFQRKHRDEDLLQGCGRQLMHWQMKSSCSIPCKKNKKSCQKKKSESIHESHICKYFFSPKASTVIETESNHDRNLKQIQNRIKTKENAGRGNGKERKRSMAYSEDIDWVALSNRDKPVPVFDPVNRTDDFLETISVKTSDDIRKNDATNEPMSVDSQDKSPDWLFARGRDLEYRMHKTDWMYHRAHDREFYRKRPADWYHERARVRDGKHHQLYGKQ